ncbi:kinase-like protein [Favolaschia claudopus]|uniref:Kinase-like protein n=1 Tax=Favolaschia claudopus TaxID=2862362 RepID=A0AAW0D261_9AGAR
MSWFTQQTYAGASEPLPDLVGSYVDEGYLQLTKLVGVHKTFHVYHALDTTTDCFVNVKVFRSGVPGSQRAAAIDHEFSLHQAVAAEPGVATLKSKFTELLNEREFTVFKLNHADRTMYQSIFHSQVYVDRANLVRHDFHQLVAAVRDIHLLGVHHRDIRPTNVWCNPDGSGVRLANFGMATQDNQSEDMRTGHTWFMSPERVDAATHPTYSPRQDDLWALALILFVMITRIHPWNAPLPSDPGYAAFRADEANNFIEKFHLTPEANDFFIRCFAPNPADRLSLDDVSVAIRMIDRFTRARLGRVYGGACIEPVRPSGTPAASVAFSLQVPVPVVGVPAAAPFADVRFLDKDRRSVTTRMRALKGLRRA